MALFGAVLGLGKLGFRGVTSVGGAAFRGGIATKAGIGASVGAIGGMVDAANYDSQTMKANAIARGALMGAIGGAAAGVALGYGPGLAKRGYAATAGRYSEAASAMMSSRYGQHLGPIARPMAGARQALVQMGADVRMGIADSKGVEGIANFVWRHPGTVAGAGTGMYAAGSWLNEGSPFESATMSGATVNINYREQDRAAATLMESNVAPMGMAGSFPQMMGPMQRAFQDSTNGLVGGLHRGRHG